ncbi:MAG: molecular chaperone HtpG [Caldilineaceae bacterium]|nr:molecular chaperone HtpG [Caldilineaceae bacterium]MCB0121417.1 molecular chaperone HtpG [Caldilineaceae bacterium]
MTETAAPAPEQMEYRTEVKQLLDILAHSLYTDREIFLRELISNASDAINRVQFELLTNHDVLDADKELAIHITVDPDAKTILIADSGIGMNHDELIENLGTIAHSGAKSFLAKAKENGKASLEEIIGQFGVGFYSVFMVADEVAVTTRSYREEDQAWTWQSKGDSQFTLTPAEKHDRGTAILIKLKEDAAEFANTWRIEQIVKKHSDYVSFPIYVGKVTPLPSEDATDDDKEGEEQTIEAPKVANRQTALWRQSASKVTEEEYKDFYQQLTYDSEAPLLTVHLVADAPVSVRSILFIPSKRERGMFNQHEYGLRLYSRKILIQQRNKDLLPEYLRFVEGVVDSEDLPLNVSREMVQSNPVLRQLQKALTNRVFRDLKNLAENDADKYKTFWHEFGPFLKEGVASDFASHEQLVELLRFQSSKTGDDEWVSLKQVKGRMGEEQKAIYYVLGEDLKSVARSPHLDYFRANDIEVLYLVDPIDGFMTSMLREYDGTSLQNVDDAGLELPDAKQDEEKADEQKKVAQDDFDKLVERFKSVLGDQVTDVRESKSLVSSPCRLVSPQDSFDRDLQRIRRLTEQDYSIPKKILELNRSHPIVVNLAQLVSKSESDKVVDAAAYQLFTNALLLEGINPNPADMVERVQTLLEAAVAAKAA